MNKTKLTAVALSLVAAQAAAQGTTQSLEKPELLLPPPADQVDAGGKNVPNLGMHQLKLIADSQGGFLKSPPVTTPDGMVPPISPAPLGWNLTGFGIPGVYLPDLAEPGGNQAALDNLLRFDDVAVYPDAMEFMNSDPSGSLDETALDKNGDPIEFNLHYPPETPVPFWLDDQGIDGASPLDDLQEILDEIAATGSKARVQEALDILLGTNVSGALSYKAYQGYPLLKYQAARVNDSYDPETRNVVVEQLWYGTEIVSSTDLLEVPAHGDFTITWKVRGLGDIGPNRERAFPIDEFTSIPMKKTSNADFWFKNSWLWKWFDAVESTDGRKYALESLYDLHTGTDAAPSYSDIDPTDHRYWLRLDRRFDMGSYVGQGDTFDFSGFHTFDLDMNGMIGGFKADGTSTGSAYSPTLNPEGQFNVYGNNEYAVPRIDWSKGPFHIPYFGYDSSFATINKGQGFDVTVRYADGEAQAGLYNWGWRVHPPRINWIETYSKDQYLPSGAPKDWRFAHKWDEVAALGLAAIGDHAPELLVHDALLAFDASPGAAGDLAAFEVAVDGQLSHMRDRRGLPDTSDIVGFPNAGADVNFLMTNMDMYSDRDTINATGKGNWAEGDEIKIAIHNDDNYTRFIRVVDFGTTDYQYNGVDMGIFDWKPVYGFPQLAASGWNPPSMTTYGFGAQGESEGYWDGTALENLGNPFYVDSFEEDLPNFWGAGERDLYHQFSNLEGFSGPGFTSETAQPYSVWANEDLAGKETSSDDLWSYSYGRPIPPNTTVLLRVEMPRASALNTGAMYMFDPQFHASSIFTMHPTSEMVPEGLDD